MTDSGYPDEAPTRPDLPRSIAATHCVHCGRVFGDHAEMFPIDLEAECMGLRHKFEPNPEDCHDDAR